MNAGLQEVICQKFSSALRVARFEVGIRLRYTRPSDAGTDSDANEIFCAVSGFAVMCRDEHVMKTLLAADMTGVP